MAALSSPQWSRAARTAKGNGFSARSTAWGVAHSRRGAAAALLLLGLNGWGLLRQWLATDPA